jgi:aspartate/methionine/tyrosine aminotransferase
MEEVARLAKKHNLIVLSDEVYEWMTYDEAQHIRMATLPGMWERTITLGYSPPPPNTQWGASQPASQSKA